MEQALKINGVSVSTTSASPLRAIVELDAANARIRLEVNEDIAHSICTELERFLTQDKR